MVTSTQTAGTPCGASESGGQLADLHDGLDLDRETQGQCGDPDSGSSWSTGISEDLASRSVAPLATRCCSVKSGAEFTKTTTFTTLATRDRSPSSARMVASRLSMTVSAARAPCSDVIVAQAAGVHRPSVLERTVAGEEQKVTAADGHHVAADRDVRGGQGEIEGHDGTAPFPRPRVFGCARRQYQNLKFRRVPERT